MASAVNVDVVAQSPDSLTSGELAAKDDRPMSASRQPWRLRVAERCRWIRSPAGLALLQLASLGLVIAWYVHVPFGVDAHTVGASYSIRLSHTKLYSDWGIAMFVLIPFLAQFAFAGMCISTEKPPRFLIRFLCASYVLLIAVGHGLGAIETHTRRANEAVFAGAFNRYYCSLRTLRVCLDGDEQSMLTLAGRSSSNASALLRESETVTNAAFVTWGRCSLVFEGGTYEIVSDTDLAPGTYVARADVADKVLSEFAGSPETDAWCGAVWAAQMSQLAQAKTTDEAIASMMSPSEADLAVAVAPYAAFTHVFAAFTSEWATRMLHTDLLVGGAAALLLLVLRLCPAE